MHLCAKSSVLRVLCSVWFSGGKGSQLAEGLSSVLIMGITVQTSAFRLCALRMTQSQPIVREG
jgi:hypothetical protein